jgi:hypothetical protein
MLMVVLLNLILGCFSPEFPKKKKKKKRKKKKKQAGPRYIEGNIVMLHHVSQRQARAYPSRNLTILFFS